MNTRQIMDLALEMAGISEVPADSGIINPAEEVEKVMIGVDIDTADLFLARELGVDLVIGHHPVTGSPAASLHQVMERQIDLMVKVGVPINKAQKVLKDRIGAVDRGRHVGNFGKLASAARLLGVPFMNIPLPLDIITESAVQSHLDDVLNSRSRVGEVIDALRELPEFMGSPAAPVVRCGDHDDYAGKVFVSMAGGTNGGPTVMKAYFEAGVGTLVLMHIPEDALKAVKEQGHGNIVVAGHMRSDSVGINRFADELESRGLEVIKMGGVVEPA